MDQFGDHGVTAHGPSQAHPTARELFGDQDVAGRAHPCLAPRLRDGQPEDAHLLHRLDELLGVGVGVVQLLNHRLHVPVHELPDDLDDLALLVDQAFHVNLLVVRVTRVIVGDCN